MTKVKTPMHSNKSTKTMDLSIRFFQEGKALFVTAFCKIPDVKEGYIFLPLGRSFEFESYWDGAFRIISILCNKYVMYRLNLDIPPLYKEIGKGTKQMQFYELCRKFPGFTQREDKQMDEVLERVYRTGLLEPEYAPEKMFGYAFEQILTTEELEKKKKEAEKPRYYLSDVLPNRGVVFDFEATSQITKYAKLIEIGAIKFENGIIIDRFHTYVNPNMSIPKKVRELTGIQQKDVENAPRAYKAVENFLSFIEGETLLIGHNILYDYKILRKFCEWYSLPFFKGGILCTYNKARKKNWEIENYRLSTILQFLGVEVPNSHRALDDCEGTFQLLPYLFEKDTLF